MRYSARVPIDKADGPALDALVPFNVSSKEQLLRKTMTAAMRRTALAVLLFALCSVAWAQVKTVRFVPHAALGALDPVWTTAYVTRNHAFLVYDTLFAPDSKGATRPQMVRSWTIDKDRVVWTFTLRDGLEFHDGSQVTSSDVEASLRRWAQRDAIGATLSRFID